MLSLGRKAGEAIVIGADIRIVVLEVGAGRVRLGLDVPRNMPIRRAELEPLDTAPAVPQEGTS